jgi:beta-phosphoglucomutase-like phosphatase (HAD superfamily)
MSKTEIAEEVEAVEQKAAREVLFFELETVATTGREAMFEAVKKVMKSKDINVTTALFSKCGITARPEAAIQAMIDNSGRNLSTADQLATQAENAMKKFFAGSAELNADLPKLIKAAQAQDMEVVAISAWPQEIAEALMTKLGLDELGVGLEAQDCTEATFPRADHWLRLLKKRDQETIPVIAIVSSRFACKGALTAGATCIAVPDAYTTFEDFAGAKIVLDSLGDSSAKELIGLVRRR